MNGAKKLDRTTLTSEAYGAVRDLLIDRTRYGPGDKVNVEKLTRELGVSRSPVWAAMARLEAEGIVEVRPRKGVFLLQFDADRIADLFEAREALEGMSARLAAGRISGASLKRLEAAVSDQRGSLEQGDLAGYNRATLVFHVGVIEAADNAAMQRLLGTIYDQVRTMCGPHRFGPAQLHTNLEDHEAILAALRNRDADQAESIARGHVRRLAEAILKSTEGAG